MGKEFGQLDEIAPIVLDFIMFEIVPATIGAARAENMAQFAGGIATLAEEESQT